MNTINYASGNVIMSMGDVPILIDGVVYKNLTVVFRLLNTIELQRIDSMRMSDDYEKEVINEEIFRSCLIDILGIDKQVNLDESSAGFITTVGESIYLMSMDYILNAQQYSQDLIASVTIVETLAAIISKFMSISYLDVIEMPINKIYKLYAVCKKTFPTQVSEIMVEEEEAPSIPTVGGE